MEGSIALYLVQIFEIPALLLIDSLQLLELKIFIQQINLHLAKGLTT